MFKILALLFQLLLLTSSKKSHKSPSRRVAAGETPNNNYPDKSQLLLFITRDDNEYYCTSTIIHKRFILTSAHCVHRAKPENIFIFYGAFDILDIQNGSKIVSIMPYYSDLFKKGVDIALLKTDRELMVSNDVIVSENRWDSNSDIINQDGVYRMCGWGFREDYKYSGKLRCMFYTKAVAGSGLVAYKWTFYGKLLNKEEHLYVIGCQGDGGAGVFYSKNSKDDYKLIALITVKCTACGYMEYNNATFLDEDLKKWVWNIVGEWKPIPEEVA